MQIQWLGVMGDNPVISLADAKTSELGLCWAQSGVESGPANGAPSRRGSEVIVRMLALLEDMEAM